jgi:cyclic pyranopterin phosphate synthase
VLRDQHQRQINYLRLSVTDRCNLRCRYCMPAGSGSLTPAGETLTRAEMLAVAAAAVSLGIRKIRITGGEPLLRADIVPFMGDLAGLPGLERLVMTTNGLLLEKTARPLREAGLSGVNISLDSLQPDRFRRITRGGDLSRVLAGLDAAVAAGLRTKLNVVVMAGVNEDELAGFVDLACSMPVSVRFIEYMPTRGGRAEGEDLTVPSGELLRRLARICDLQPLPEAEILGLAGPARNFLANGGRGRLGIISPVTDHFCQDCNRIRVTSREWRGGACSTRRVWT